MKTGKNVIETLIYFEKQEKDNPKLINYASYKRLTMQEHLKSVRRLYNYCLALERENETLKRNLW